MPSMRVVPLSGSHADWFAVIDVEDYELVSSHKWYLTHSTSSLGLDYAQTTITEDGKQKVVKMHNLIMGTTNVGHRDNNGLNNMKSNLRVATFSQNMGNRRKTILPTASGFKGVYRADRGKWRAMIYDNGRNRFLGQFTSEEEAARAYDTAAKRKWGEFAKLNFPDENELAHLPLLVQIAAQCRDDAERWFALTDDLTNSLMGVMGELSECIEYWKKVRRGTHTLEQVKDGLAEEVTDVFIYLMNIAGILRMDLEQTYKQKRELNEKRFGGSSSD